MVSDERGNLILLSNITDSDALTMKIFSTKFTRIKDLQAFEGLFLAAVTHIDGEGKLVLWDIPKMLQETEDLAEQKAALVLKCGIGRLTCLNLQRVHQNKGMKSEAIKRAKPVEEKQKDSDATESKKKKKKQRLE